MRGTGEQSLTHALTYRVMRACLCEASSSMTESDRRNPSIAIQPYRAACVGSNGAPMTAIITRWPFTRSFHPAYLRRLLHVADLSIANLRVANCCSLTVVSIDVISALSTPHLQTHNGPPYHAPIGPTAPYPQEQQLAQVRKKRRKVSSARRTPHAVKGFCTQGFYAHVFFLLRPSRFRPVLAEY